ncbi:MAG TPA: cobyric acid synthase [Chloroflexota bacterium]|nr:cobyric acid synthase [Chloroflexota bacterium]
MSGRTVMVQGTASGVGKTVLVAALCRLLRRAGLRVAPFKAQNMSNNAAVTVEGGEIGRAQAMQAQAAGVPPSVDMNPILLKPEGEARAQVIVRGRVWQRLSAQEYHAAKPALQQVVAESLARLRARFDVVVIEGAGSPAEINLQASDLVNMAVARLADAPVLLVADIDRGGAFAALVGTLELLAPADRARVCGLIINRFRGDPALLAPGLAQLSARTGCPVLGVVPYLPDLGLPDEDSQALEARQPAEPDASGLDIAVIRFPRIANFDDFAPLETERAVRLRYVSAPGQLGVPDLVILPGTKSTLADLAWLRASGLGPALLRLAAAGTPLLGICGGFQMLGRRLLDPHGADGVRGEALGLGLLEVETVFSPEKATRQVAGRVVARSGLFGCAADLPLTGYEIHLGRTHGPAAPFAELAPVGATAPPAPDGAVAADGLTAGTYLHGLFHNQAVRRALLGALARRRGIALPEPAAAGADPLDRLADVVSASVDLQRLYTLCRLPVGGGRDG